MAAKRVFVVGAAGQDGKLLAENARASGDEFFAVDRGLGADVLDGKAIARAIADFAPTELHYLAAHHHSSEDVQDAPAVLHEKSFAIHVVGWVNVLEAVQAHARDCGVFYAASSHVFSGSPTQTQDESTPFAPVDAYGITKVAGVHVARSYRARGLRVSVGYLYNHESRYRRPGFVSSRIVQGAGDARRAALRGEPSELRLGDLDAVVDWGYAPDYVAAMRAIVLAESADDFVVASGEPHTVEDFAREAFAAVGLDFRAHVRQDGSLLHKRTNRLIGNAAKLRAATGWRPSLSFPEMVQTLVRTRLA